MPIKEATDVIIVLLNKDDELTQFTKLKINEIKTLIEICLSRCYFVWNNEFHELQNSGPIGLSLMVVMAEAFLQVLEANAIDEALFRQPPVNIKTFMRFVDDSHARFPKIGEADQFKEILNKQNPRIQYTMESENAEKTLEFLDITIINSGQGKYEFDVFRKDAITNVQVKPTSAHDPKILIGAFKGFVHRAFKICSKNYLEQELEFLTNIFIENGYDKNELVRTIKDIRKKIEKDNTTTTNNKQQNDVVLPRITLPWIPGVSSKLRKAYKKAGYQVVFKSKANLKTILTAKNKVQLPKNSRPGVYKIPCDCKKVPPYIGQTKLQIRTRADQHKKYVAKGQWENSGAAKHAKTCKAGPNFEQTETIAVEYNTFNRRVRETLEIQKHEAGPKEGGINLDDGMYVKTKFWLPYLRNMSKKECKVTSNRSPALTSN